MKIAKRWTAFLVLAFAAFCHAAPGGESPKIPVGWASGVGASSLEDPAKAGSEAAAMAKAALGGSPAKFVMVAAAISQVTPELVRSVAEHFPVDIIYGGQVTSPLTSYGNHPDYTTLDIDAGVAVWALGGTTEVQVAEVSTARENDDDVYYNAGVELAEKLKDALENSEKPGKLVFTWGDQYTGSNKVFAAGLNEGFGKTWPIVGGASGNITAKVIVRGEIVTGVDVGVVIAGDFSLGQAMNGGTHTPETADQTLVQALEDGEGEPFFALVFNCRRRRKGMIDSGELAKELEVMRNRLPGVSFFGFYGPGEIGSQKFGEEARGMGFTVAAAVFFPVKDPGEPVQNGEEK